MITEGDTQERMELVRGFANEAISLARDYILASGRSQKTALSSLFVARAAQAMKSCSILAELGAIGDAMSVARTIVELDIEHAYIMQKDTEQRWERYVAFETVSRDRLVQAMAVLHEGKVDQKALERSRRAAATAKGKLSRKKRKQQRQRHEPQSGSRDTRDSVKNRAHATGRRDQYDLVYADMCGASHGGFSTLWYVTRPTDKLPFEVLIGFAAPAAKPIVLALASFFLLLSEATDNVHLNDLNSKVEELAKRFQTDHSKQPIDPA